MGGFETDLMEGPDQVIPCNNLVTSEMDGAVKLRLERSGPLSNPAISVPGRLMKTAKDSPSALAFKQRDIKTGTERVWTYSQYLDEVKTVAKAFISLGFDRFQSVCILGFNSPEWVISDLAAIFAGGMAAGIYPTNGPEACHFIIEDSKCAILVVEDQKQLDKVWRFRNEMPNIKKIVQYTGVPTHPGVISWKDLLSLGKSQPDTDLSLRLRQMAVNQCCTLIYTSGTTGNPKGVMLSHDNVLWSTQCASDLHSMEYGNTRMLSYLPLSHIAGQMFDIYAPMMNAGTVFFADKDVLKSTLLDNLGWARPTEFLGVPRVWEKVMEKMLEKGKAVTGLKKTVSTKAKLAGLEWHKNGTNEKTFKFYKKIYYSKVKVLLGLDQCRTFLSGAAPLMEQTSDYFLSLDIRIAEAYGMSENSAVCTMQTNKNFKRGSVGQAVPGMKTKLVQSGNDSIDSERELWTWSRSVMMGYAGREDANTKDMTEDGWLKTGDLVREDDQGFHYIVGREKDLIITAGGENVAPQPIHERVLENLPIISQVLLLGDKQKYISSFLTLAVEINPDTMEPSNRLTSAARDWCRDVAGSPATTVEDVLKGPDSRVMRAIQTGIDRANKESVSRAQVIQKWMVLPRDFSIPGGEMGPTMKVKRNYVTKKYQHCIEKIYNV